MPPKRRPCANQRMVDILKELQDEVDEDSKFRFVYGKAIKSLSHHPAVLNSPEDAIKLDGVGPAIVKKLKKAMEGGDAPSPSSPPKRRGPGRTKKDAPVASASRTASTSTLPPVSRSNSMRSLASTSSTASYLAEAAEFRFAFLDASHNPIAEITNVMDDRFEVIYPDGQQHDHEAFLESPSLITPGSKIHLAFMPAELARSYEFRSTWDGNCAFTPPPAATGSASGSRLASLKELLAGDTQGPRRGNSSLDPSRSFNQTLPPPAVRRTATLPTQSTQSVSSSMERSRSLNNVAPAMAHNIAQTQVTSSSSAPTGRAPSLMAARSRTMNAMPPPPAPVRTLPRTTSTPTTGSSTRPPTHEGRPRTGRPRLSHAVPTLTADDEMDVDDPYATYDNLNTNFVPRILRRGSYDIMLVLDNREVKVRRDPKEMEDLLRARGVPVSRRALNLGDVCWIAISKIKRHDGYDELALDYILERKRMDDLFGSIKDGRFHEQKFRLHNSGMTHVFYVVEHYSCMKLDDPTWVKAINTALSSTQVGDGFMVQETKALSNTIDHYVSLHQAIVEHYKDKDIHVVPNEYVHRYNYLGLQQTLRLTDRSFVTSYETFQTLNSKNGFRTVRDTWARMLLCITGVSAEKASAIIAVYPTPRDLRVAFVEAERVQRKDQEARNQADRDGVKKTKLPKVRMASLLLEHLGGESTRRIGPALSGKIYSVFMSRDYQQST